MAFDEGVAQRLREALGARGDVLEKRMFGGIAFMVGGHMCVGVIGESMMARVGPARYAEALQRPHAREMDFTGRAMTGFVHVAPQGFESDSALGDWLGLCLEFVDTLPRR
ncbi:MAG: TfoX/Sxy family protein [Burkholderiaceae bacterium]|nr:TfoX/Sxy family protein [Burkholderiaceae bacterium]